MGVLVCGCVGVHSIHFCYQNILYSFNLDSGLIDMQFAPSFHNYRSLHPSCGKSQCYSRKLRQWKGRFSD